MTTSILGMKQRMNNPQAQFDKEKIVTKYRRHCSLMVRLSLLLMLASVAVECEAEEATFRMSSLVLPQGVSYTLGPVMLTRALEQATSANKTGKTTSLQSREASNIKKIVGSGVESSTSSGHSSGYNLGGSIGGSSSGSGGVSLMGLLGVNLGGIGGKISGEDSLGQKTTSRNGTESTSENSRQGASGLSSEFEEQEQYGSYHLRFTVSFKSKDPSDTFLVGGPNSSVILNGFSAPVKVPYTERNEAVRLGAEERILFFDYPIADQVTLRDAKRFAATGRRNAVTLSLTGDDFPVISERTKYNVVSEITRIMQTIPNTVVSLDFGEVKRLSPWRIRRKFARNSGRGGRCVTIREALESLNEVIAKDEEMPEVTFKFAKDGRLETVGDMTTLAPPRKDDLTFVAVSVVMDTHGAETEVHFPTKDFLSRSLSDFTEVRLVQLQLSELVQASMKAPETMKALCEEVESALPSVDGAEKLWRNLRERHDKKEAANKADGKTKAGSEKDDSRSASLGRETQQEYEESSERKGLKTGDTKTITLPGGATMEMIYCGPGSFVMGSPISEVGRADDERQHRVRITRGFWLGKYEVTQSQWQSVMGMNHPENQNSQHPVEHVSWDDSQIFIQRVRTSAKLDVRLPSEAEWEYACRAGTKGPIPGDSLDDIAWYGKLFGSSRTMPVGMKSANPWGFCDMLGNVWEWCLDWYDYYPDGPVSDPVNMAVGSKRVARGGGCHSYSRYCRSAYRRVDKPSVRDDDLGFRLCCSAGLSE